MRLASCDETRIKDMSKKRDLTNKIERLEALEERLHVSLSGLSAFFEEITPDSLWLNVRGEIQPTNGPKLSEEIELQIAAYDPSGRIIGTSIESFDPDTFFGIEVFDRSVSLDMPDVARVRIYPKKP